ncbi:MAG TPA: hypothetical protein VN963_09330 [bacterium]|nr:hypothetical protein [bacterium]
MSAAGKLRDARSNPDHVQWNALGMASGVYIVAVQARDANGGVLENQLLKILVLH